LGFLTAGATERGLAAHNELGVVVVLVLIGGSSVFWIRRAIRPGPAIVIDDAAFTDVYAGRVVEWSSVRSVHITERSGMGGQFHRLVFTVVADVSVANATEKVETRIDWLSVGWTAVLATVESHVGTTVQVLRERGPIVRV
jgi:hypothetical protein